MKTSKLVQEVGLYAVTAEDATELADSDRQQFSNECFEEMDKELSQEEEEKERDEEPPLQCTKTSDISALFHPWRPSLRALCN